MRDSSDGTVPRPEACVVTAVLALGAVETLLALVGASTLIRFAGVPTLFFIAAGLGLLRHSRHDGISRLFLGSIGVVNVVLGSILTLAILGLGVARYIDEDGDVDGYPLEVETVTLPEGSTQPSVDVIITPSGGFFVATDVVGWMFLRGVSAGPHPEPLRLRPGAVVSLPRYRITTAAEPDTDGLISYRIHTSRSTDSGAPGAVEYRTLGELAKRYAKPEPPLPPPPPPPPPAVPPLCTLKADPYRLQGPGSTTLSWNTTNAASAVIDGMGVMVDASSGLTMDVSTNGGGPVDPVAAGSHMVGVEVPTTYTMSAAGPGGIAKCTATVVVEKPVVDKDQVVIVIVPKEEAAKPPMPGHPPSSQAPPPPPPPPDGRLRIRPWGSLTAVRVDNRPVQVTRDGEVTVSLPAGTHDVLVNHAGGNYHCGAVNIYPGRTSEIVNYKILCKK